MSVVLHFATNILVISFVNIGAFCGFSCPSPTSFTPYLITKKMEIVTLRPGEGILLRPAGEGCTVYAVKGSIEIAGVALRNHAAYPFDEDVLCYSTIGGQLCVVGEGVVTIPAPVELDSVWKLVKRLTQQHEGGQEAARVVVLGAGQCGKSLASAILANSLSRALGVGVSYCDLSPRNNLVTTGFVSSCTVSPQVAMWRGSPWEERQSVAGYFCGCASLSESVVASYLGTASVAVDGALWRVTGGGCSAAVFDFPDCDEASPATVIMPLLDFVRPTHVVVVGDFVDVVDAIRRRFPGVALVKSEPLLRLVGGNPNEDASVGKARLQRYFGGSQASPKTAHKVSCRLSELTFLAVQSTSSFLECRPVRAADVPVPSILSVSLADSEKEVPFANSAGVVWLVDIDEERNEASLYMPSGSHELPSGFLVLPLPGQMPFNTLL